MKSSRGIFSGTFLLKINNICIFDYNMAKLRVKFMNIFQKNNVFDIFNKKNTKLYKLKCIMIKGLSKK